MKIHGMSSKAPNQAAYLIMELVTGPASRTELKRSAGLLLPDLTSVYEKSVACVSDISTR